MSSRFSDLGVPAVVVSSLAVRGITSPFPIQALVIPDALAGRDVCGRAPTGSGKTLAFGIPLSQRVTAARTARPRALVLVPTRELAAQITNELRLLLDLRQRTVACFHGGVSFSPQLKALRRGVDVAVACPGRLADLVRRGDVILDEVGIVVIDEADRMADMGFLPEVRRLLDQVRPDRQTMLFSATLDRDVDVLVQRYQRHPVRCDVAPVDADRTTHQFLHTRPEQRLTLTADLVARHGSTIIFCRTKHGADRLARQLQHAGVSAVPIHGGRSQSHRHRALKSFSEGRAQALVATDVAARGIHIDNVDCVVHFDVAGDHKDYLHRSGRTGRAGARGVVVSLVTDADLARARQLQKALRVPVGPLVGQAANTATSTATSTRSRKNPGRGGRALATRAQGGNTHRAQTRRRRSSEPNQPR